MPPVAAAGMTAADVMARAAAFLNSETGGGGSRAEGADGAGGSDPRRGDSAAAAAVAAAAAAAASRALRKSQRFQPFSLQRPHHLSFHLAWAGGCAVYVAAFAPAALLPVIGPELRLTRTRTNIGGVAALLASVATRFLLASAVRRYGPRYCQVFTLMVTAPVLAFAALMTDAQGFVVVRALLGASLGLQLVTQCWVVAMFDWSVLGAASAAAAGLTNAGGGLAALLLPLCEGVRRMMSSGDAGAAWRTLLHALALLCAALAALTFLLATGSGGEDDGGRDSGYGAKVEEGRGGSWGGAAGAALIASASGGCSRHSSCSGAPELLVEVRAHLFTIVLRNPVCWLLAVNHCFTFGAQLVAFNILPLYLTDRFRLSPASAGALAAAFGLLNVGTRVAGGAASNALSRRYGMRGRLWALWGLQVAGGVCCVLVGTASRSSLAGTAVLLLLFGAAVQTACGVAFTITNFVSYRGYAVVLAVVTAVGQLGAAVLQAAFFSPSSFTYSLGFKLMGLSSLAAAFSLLALRFPMWGGMLTRGSAAEDVWAEERYYAREWSSSERAQGMAAAAATFAWLAKAERGPAASVPTAMLSIGVVRDPG
ncbi:hypothetical protein GPECTOR_40g517 [Gonium pectorale]|uniref:Major facilitator superfamily (MFS) profile domain-containing protein n=1 Tax=Gonium pectorale TaxID=33097 RepID=A0A150GAI7_GONPE|nr:hypothetical protein GPECTOR_40g517 [Gonium pectorale]|eukprot:KXZ46783.1 hypothetical protein GPECTOR_40g517 [Gonium pectorale]